MQDLARALGVTRRIRTALQGEVTKSEVRRLIRALDADALMAGANLRAEFNTLLARLEVDLAGHLAGVAAALGTKTLDLGDIALRWPDEARELGGDFEEIRSLAAALRELDDLNRLLAKKAVACVRGYLSAIVPPPEAYGRHGASTTTGITGTMRRVA